LIAWVFCGPFIALFATFGVWPVLSSLSMSVTDITARDIRTPFSVNFVGLGHYTALFGDPNFLRAALNTAYFVVVGIPLTMIVALTLAVVGIHGPDWLNDPNWAMPALILMAVWRHFGIPMVIFLAGLQSIPADLLEAARVDGATRWQAFRSITLPLLRPTTLVVAVLLSIGYLQFFEEPFVMTSGGPLGSTTSISYYAYEQFGFGNYGTASAASYVLVAAIALLSFLQFRIFRAKA